MHFQIALTSEHVVGYSASAESSWRKNKKKEEESVVKPNSADIYVGQINKLLKQVR